MKSFSTSLAMRFISCRFRATNPSVRTLIIVSLALLLESSAAFGQTPTWKNTGASPRDWNSNGSWDNGLPTSTDSALFTGARVADANLSATATINQLQFSTTGTGYTIGSTGGFTLTINAATAIDAANTSGANTLSAPFILGGALNSTQTITQASGGTLNLSGPLTSTNSLTVSFNGAGIVNLTGDASHVGPTTVTGGNLTLGTGGSLSATSSVAVNTGGTLLLNSTTNQINNSAGVTLAGGTLQLGANGTNETVGALTLTSSSIIDFGNLSGTNNMIFADSSAIGWTGTLSVWNWTQGTDHLYFGSVLNSGLISTQLGQITFYSDSGTTSLGTARFGDLNGEVSPVPEPSAVLVGLSLLSLCGYRERRWFLRCPEARRRVFA